MTTENFFERISNGKSMYARNASNVFFGFACLCSPGIFFEMAKFDPTSKISDLESWFFPLLGSMGFLFFAYDIRNFTHGKKVHLDNSLYFEANKRNTPVRWLSLVLDMTLCGFCSHMAISQYSHWHLKLL